MTCGTITGYRVHKSQGQVPCDWCREVYERMYGRDLTAEEAQAKFGGDERPPFQPRSRKGADVKPVVRRAPRERDICGSEAGYQQHVKMREESCTFCADAHGRVVGK